MCRMRPVRNVARTPSVRRDVPFSLKTSAQDMNYMRELAKKRGLNSVAEAYREVVHNLRTMFDLPEGMAERLRADMGHHDILTYLKDLVGKRLEELLAEGDRPRGKQ